ncbi:hypothetical protein BASA84_001096 [Batrachochytrium salamandrivorans]|nr:hypothetical protein BASA84_001096 [Batrachochytrium salamandrivorans]
MGFFIQVMNIISNKLDFEVLKNAAANGLVIDAVNIMAMDYESGAALNGATGMGGYAIASAQATLMLNCNRYSPRPLLESHP